MGKKKCSCLHVGNCPFGSEPLRMTYPDGVPVFRDLRPEELKAATLCTPSHPELNTSKKGDSVATDGCGTMVVAARALDPDRIVSYSEKMKGRVCKAGNASWRRNHPHPSPVAEA